MYFFNFYFHGWLLTPFCNLKRYFTRCCKKNRENHAYVALLTDFRATWLGIFLRGVPGRFEKWSISSHIRVQIIRESVRLIYMIGLNMFFIHIKYRKSLKIFQARDCNCPFSEIGFKMPFLSLKVFISNFFYYNLYWRKLKVTTRPQYVLRFFIWHLNFSLVDYGKQQIFTTPWRQM